jgi:hypothetical protein
MPNLECCRTTLQVPDGIGLVPAQDRTLGPARAALRPETENRRRVVAKCVPPLLSVLFSASHPSSCRRVARQKNGTPCRLRLMAGLAVASCRNICSARLGVYSGSGGGCCGFGRPDVSVSRSRLSPLPDRQWHMRIRWKYSLPRREEKWRQRKIKIGKREREL